ncbi:endo1,3(4)-beta-glucanase, putative [Acanthamoeba castellanii str. Neff]|uniref:Endo1,3(4)-beta-glucanase, putative n=1 Tax=Acanthamoeba castellanii (strain ATCC 30010 / Neff) TaxID=1257118 RepID=L8GIY9_ACACF|nr:endo1,3(4)-beta-glucanase, putative [Acanthamoeba castellanii str. Neff]ELR12824.1 endo1,3(4)-beta-glucanase, putative [Acanthamoeba castellanii str. Neff]
MKPTAGLLCSSLLIVLALACTAQGAGYSLTWEAKGSTFFDKFNFITYNDPSLGFVNYGYISVKANGQVKLKPDTSNVVAAGARGRDSVRLESKTLFNGGVFVADVAHMPTGCGTWPAWWTYGPSWPTNGEIDIIEGVNRDTVNAATLHTSAGCDMTSVNQTQLMTGTFLEPNCDTTAGNGCGVDASANSYGAPFNTAGGGVYALEWTTWRIRVWYFNRTRIPADITAGNPNPAAWGKPFAYFALGTNCPASHFRNHTMTINLTFCGAWAGNSWVWGSDSVCAAKGTCVDFVRKNPSAFTEAYWLFNSVRAYQWAN